MNPIFDIIKQYKSNSTTRFSIDTYHYEMAKIAIKNGFNIINDVSGFKDNRMWNLLRDNDIEAIIMHSLTIPADRKITLTKNCDPVKEIKLWIRNIIKKCNQNNIDLSKIIIDPGIGFNKTAVQSLKIIQNIKQLQNQKYRILVGHSKKSFMQIFTQNDAQDRLIETLGISIELTKKGIDIIRVHDQIEHKRMFLANLYTI